MRVIIVAIVSLAIGFGIGCIPFVNEHLHWNIWFIIPISGVILGTAFGAVQFFGARALRLFLGSWAVGLLAVAGAASYFATEYGVYFSTSIEVTDAENIPDGEYVLRDLMTFDQYMSAVLGVTYAVDMVGCLVATAATLPIFREKSPYCLPCGRYERREKLHEIVFPELAAEDLKEAFVQLLEHAAENNYRGALNFIGELERSSVPGGNFKLSVDERYCSSCLQASLVGHVFRRKGTDWDEINDLAFQLESERGEHSSATYAAA